MRKNEHNFDLSTLNPKNLGEKNVLSVFCYSVLLIQLRYAINQSQMLQKDAH